MRVTRGDSLGEKVSREMILVIGSDDVFLGRNEKLYTTHADEMMTNVRV